MPISFIIPLLVGPLRLRLYIRHALPFNLGSRLVPIVFRLLLTLPPLCAPPTLYLRDVLPP